MTKQELLSVVALFNISLTFAETGNIKGSIFQKDSVSPVSNVSVYLENTRLGTISNGNGQFVITNVPSGDYTLTASCIGYQTFRQNISVKDDETIHVIFSLKETVMDLPAVVIQSVTMTGGNAGIKEVPGSACYISPKEIQRFNYSDMNRTLRTVPGVNVQEEDGFGLRPNIGFRGTDVLRSAAITVMEDGVLSSPAPYASPAAYYFPTVGRMQSVEILKGSSQIKYGPYTTGGAINLISTQIPDEFSGRIFLTAGSFGNRNLHAYAGDSFKNFGYMVETYQYKSDGFKQLDNGGNTGFDKKDFLAKFRVNTNTKIEQSLTFKAGISSETSNETYLGLKDDDYQVNPYRRYSASQMDEMNTSQSQLSLTHSAELSKNISITTTAYRNEFQRNWYKLAAFIIEDTLTGEETEVEIDDEANDDAYTQGGQSVYDAVYGIMTGTRNSLPNEELEMKANNRKYFAEGVQTVVNFNFNTGSINHKIDVGGRLHRDGIDRFQWKDIYKMENNTMILTEKGTPGTESNRLETAEALATYIQYKVKYDNLSITPGVRYENMLMTKKDFGKKDTERTGTNLKEYENTAVAVLPGIGVDYKFSSVVNLFAGAHKGFSPPGSTDGAQPEESINYEAGTRFGKKSLNGQVVAFYNDYKNLLGSDLAAAGGTGSGDLYNGGAALSQGLETQLSYDLISSATTQFSLPLTVVYTYTDAFFKSSFDSNFEGWGKVQNGDKLPYIAQNQLSCMVALEHKKFSVNVSGKYSDAMRTRPGQGAMNPVEATDSYFIVDASANYFLSKNASLFTSVTNITGETYIASRRPAGIRPGMPRTAMAGIKVNF